MNIQELRTHIDKKFDTVFNFLTRLERNMALDKQAVLDHLNGLDNTIMGAITLMNTLHAAQKAAIEKANAAGIDTTDFQEIANFVDAEKAKLLEAIVANTDQEHLAAEIPAAVAESPAVPAAA